MFKAQLKFQKILSYILIVVFALFFIFSLCVLTDVSFLRGAYNSDLTIPDWVTQEILAKYTHAELISLGFVQWVDGAKIFYDMQSFNSQLLVCSLIVLFVVLYYMISGSHTRRRYYISNYVSAGLIVIANFAVAIFALIKTLGYRAEFLNVLSTYADDITYYCEKRAVQYTDSTFWFDFGCVVSVLLIIAALLSVFNLMWKINLMKKEDNLLQYGDAENHLQTANVKEAV